MDKRTYLLNIKVQTSISQSADLHVLEINCSPAAMRLLYTAIPSKDDFGSTAICRDMLRVLGENGNFSEVAYSERAAV